MLSPNVHTPTRSAALLPLQSLNAALATIPITRVVVITDENTVFEFASAALYCEPIRIVVAMPHPIYILAPIWAEDIANLTHIAINGNQIVLSAGASQVRGFAIDGSTASVVAGHIAAIQRAITANAPKQVFLGHDKHENVLDGSGESVIHMLQLRSGVSFSAQPVESKFDLESKRRPRLSDQTVTKSARSQSPPLDFASPGQKIAPGQRAPSPARNPRELSPAKLPPRAPALPPQAPPTAPGPSVPPKKAPPTNPSMEMQRETLASPPAPKETIKSKGVIPKYAPKGPPSKR